MLSRERIEEFRAALHRAVKLEAERQDVLPSNSIKDCDELCDTALAYHAEKANAHAWSQENARLCESLYGARCVYCGETVGKEKKNQQIADEVLREHVTTCEKHPLNEMRKRAAQAERQLADRGEPKIISYVNQPAHGDSCKRIIGVKIDADEFQHFHEATDWLKSKIEPAADRGAAMGGGAK